MEHGLVLSIIDYVITYKNCLVIWVIQIQTEIALSNMEAEYIALSQSMSRDNYLNTRQEQHKKYQ